MVIFFSAYALYFFQYTYTYTHAYQVRWTRNQPIDVKTRAVICVKVLINDGERETHTGSFKRSHQPLWAVFHNSNQRLPITCQICNKKQPTTWTEIGHWMNYSNNKIAIGDAEDDRKIKTNLSILKLKVNQSHELPPFFPYSIIPSWIFLLF